MKPIRLDQWALAILNETIRADAEFQLNQRSSWQEFAREPLLFNGVDIAAGMQHHRNLMVREVSFDFTLVPARPGFLARVMRFLKLQAMAPASVYRLPRAGEANGSGVGVKIIVTRDAENRYRSDVKIEGNQPLKAEEIHVAGVTG